MSRRASREGGRRSAFFRPVGSEHSRGLQWKLDATMWAALDRFPAPQGPSNRHDGSTHRRLGELSGWDDSSAYRSALRLPIPTNLSGAECTTALCVSRCPLIDPSLFVQNQFEQHSLTLIFLLRACAPRLESKPTEVHHNGGYEIFRIFGLSNEVPNRRGSWTCTILPKKTPQEQIHSFPVFPIF